MDERQKKILSGLFGSGVSEKLAPPPKWYGNLLFVILGTALAGIINIVASNLNLGLVLIALSIAAYISTYFHRRTVVLRAFNTIDLMAKVDMEKFLKERTFTICRKCEREVSKRVNYVNMFLIGINDPLEYDKLFGMMCLEHANEITSQIMREKNLNKNQLKAAYEKAEAELSNENEILWGYRRHYERDES